MILIYNLSGLLIGALGVLAGLFAAMATGNLSVGIFCIAAVWLVVGMWWRRGPILPPPSEEEQLALQTAAASMGQTYEPPTGPIRRKRRHASIFFIPLPILAVPVAALAVLTVGLEGRGPKDPRDARLRADESSLRTRMLSGDEGLARFIYDQTTGESFDGAVAEGVSVLVKRAQPDPSAPCLVLVRIENLKEFSPAGQSQLLDVVEEALHLDGQTGPTYIGIKGRLIYGAARTPRGSQTRVADRDSLYDFYGPLEAPAPDARPAATAPR